MEPRLFTPEPAEPCAGFARVAVERGVDLAEGLVYAVPERLNAVRVGDRVEAPLGRGVVPGIVVERIDEPDLPPEKIKPLGARLGAALPPDLVDLARWICGYYVAPLGVTLAAMLPGLVKGGVDRAQRRLLAPAPGAPPLERRLPPRTRDAWERISAAPPDRFPASPRDLAALGGVASVGPINRLVEAGLLRDVSPGAHEPGDAPGPADAPPTLTDEQTACVEGVCETLADFGVHLLRGVTGSGKTEVYLRVLERVVRAGKRAVVLVPEISLTPQTSARFLDRFAARGVAVLHSGLTPAQRRDAWERVRRGEVSIVVGARSAVFAPFPPLEEGSSDVGLGLIVVDEEHDGAYKQDQAPRYHARDVAIRRAQRAGCPVLLGSATPSLEAWWNAAEGRWRLHTLTRRATGARMPTVRVVDFVEEMRRAPDRDRSVRLIGPTLENALNETLDAGAQALLLLNRRGYASYICCPDQRCGFVLCCDRCDAAMVQHRGGGLPSGGVVRCHHCLAERRLPPTCPLCARRLSTFGMGTQRVEEELRRVLQALEAPESLLRLDSDSVRGGVQWHGALDRLRSGAARVAIGTQMIAKGHDIPNVRLVGVINADTSINLPDFRAAERTFQLISQVAGRAGRAADRPGSVVVQTFSPGLDAVTLAARHDYEGFANREMEVRRRAMLPPAGRMARFVVRDQDHDRAARRAAELRCALRAHTERLDLADVRFRGPMPAAISRIADEHRIAIEILAPNSATIQRLLTAARNAGDIRSDASLVVDVDPIALL